MNILTADGKPVSDDASRVCILFDPNDGRVVHVHGATVLPPGKAIDAAEMEVRARRHAANLGKSTADLWALHVPIAALRARGPLRVNQRGDGLEPVPQKPRPK